MVRVDVVKAYCDAWLGEPARPRLGRSHEVGLELGPLRRVRVLEAKQVEVRDAVVAVADREGRARHRGGHAECPAGTADEGRLARADLAGDGDDVPGQELHGQTRGQALGLLRRACSDCELQNSPSWTT